MHTLAWSELYLDYITHYPENGTFGPNGFRRATVCIIGPSTFQLSKWYKGCGFSPEVVNYKSLEEAKQAGVAWTEKAL